MTSGGKSQYTYEASPVDDYSDPVAWMVRRTDENGKWDEALMPEIPRGITADEVIKKAVERRSWA